MQRFLCWDGKMLSENNGVSVVQHKPEKKNIALVCDCPWEGVHNGYASLVKVGDTYRLYYRAWGQNGLVYKDEKAVNKSVICLAESKDGITFKKPDLNKFEFEGIKENNIVFFRDNGRNIDTFTLFYDQNPACPETEKFKALVRDQGTDILDFYISPDGIDFTFAQRIDLPGTFDSYNAVFFDEEEKIYKLYFRGYHRADGSIVGGYGELNETTDIRDVRLAVSEDFRAWKFIDFIKFEKDRNVQLYTNQITPYYREKSTLIGLPARYFDRVGEAENYKDMPIFEARQRVIEKSGRGGTAQTDCGIMTSKDGITFDLRPTAFLTSGIENSNGWWYGDCYTAYGMAETLCEDGENREISIYAGENYHVKKVDFRRYTVRLDGFFSWYADGDGGFAVSSPFLLKGENMSVNFATSALGKLKITILDKKGEKIEGYESGILFGNSTDRAVSFEKPLTNLVGKEISVKFELCDCNLYSFAFS